MHLIFAKELFCILDEADEDDNRRSHQPHEKYDLKNPYAEDGQMEHVFILPLAI